MALRDETLADGANGRTDHVVKVIGSRPRYRPYLSVGTLDGRLVCTITNANALRGLARRILRALGDSPVPGETEKAGDE